MPSPVGGEQHEPPIGGALYRHAAHRGLWRLETAGWKWITFRSLDVFNSQTVVKERRDDWPNGWTRI